MKESGNVLISGVGGQGILLASEVTALAFIQAGYDVKKSEVHGMAQRGGAVVAHLRYGEKVYSPLIEPGTVDVALSLELLESLRYLPYYNKETKLVLNTQRIPPSSVATGVQQYPPDVTGVLKEKGIRFCAVDALGIAGSLGEPRVVNIVMVGAMSLFVPVREEVFIDVIKERVPEKFREVNLGAFSRGREAARGLSLEDRTVEA